MVAASVPHLGKVPTLCLARPMLFAALDRYDRRDFVGAGVRLREAVRRFLVAACEWYGVDPPKGKHPRPVEYAKALHKAGYLGDWRLDVIKEMLYVGNRAAHCESVELQLIRSGISFLFSFMDGEMYVGSERTPICHSYGGDGPCDCDDDCNDDGDDFDGDDWKGGA